MTEFTHAAVAAFAGTAGNDEALTDKLEAAIASTGVVFGASVVLGRAPLAIEIRIAADAAQAARVRTTIADALAEVADTAVVPLPDRRKRLLISDMDSTIIEQECLDELADFAGLKAEISAITERAMQGELNFEEALTERVSMLKGLDLSALARCYSERITLTPGAETLVKTMTANGARCVLVSGGFTYFTERVAKAAGFQTHRGNTLLDDGAALTGKVGRPILGREAKLNALMEETAAMDVQAADAIAIGDGANDLAMITAAGLGVAFRAKPIVAEDADAAITYTDLRTALYFQGYSETEFAT